MALEYGMAADRVVKLRQQLEKLEQSMVKMSNIMQDTANPVNRRALFIEYMKRDEEKVKLEEDLAVAIAEQMRLSHCF